MSKNLAQKDRQELFGRLSKYLEDISKLVFAGVVLSSIMKEEVDTFWLVSCGTAVALLALYGAYVAYRKSKK